MGEITGLARKMLAAMPERPSVEELDACFVVRDANGQQLSYV
jgi:hypothetical protein